MRVDHEKHGLATVELAIVLPVLLLLILGGIEYGLQIQTDHVMTEAAREAARQMAVRGGTAADAKALALDRLSGIHANFTVTVTGPNASRDVTVHISVPRTDVSMGWLTGGTIETQITMRKED